ncbi:uncharacterized protein LOC129950422 [Eupeodes corollae]|uniref:uncharacterized protein LOC129950422 n=1 Tax=Eupeodes corollae TaxID=290404 RepID=UPI00249311AC|nr:uncharacterized protein LOC129950422 [Eupeodes corollae]
MKCLERRLDGDPDLKDNVHRQINEYEVKGYIRKLSQEELNQHHDRVWYLPIFPVRNPNKPEKVRLVWDAAAKVEGVSLNTLLMKGIDWNASLLGVLIRSRQNKVCIFGDIKEMFHQVQIPAKDQQVLRFLWRSNTNEEPDTYVMQVMTFGATCSPSCAQYIKNCNALKYEEEFPKAVKIILESHYVDDFLESVDTEMEAIQLARDVTTVHAKASFEIRNWKSNSLTVMKALNAQPTDDYSDLNPSVDPALEKVLGMWWSQRSDEYTFSLRFNKGNQQVLNGEHRPTKRDILRILMSIYDPLGQIAHFLVYLKILLQDIWRSRVDWNVPVTDDHFESWKIWLKVLPQVERCRIPRCLLKNLPNWLGTTVQLHVFMDASEQACATVAYIRISSENHIECSLLGAKTKVAPIKLRSVPRLELGAAVMGCRFAKKLTDEMSITVNKIFFWSDSKTVLSWINGNPHRYNKFVAFRVAEVQDNDQGGSWRYIQSKFNVADDATKWTRPPTLDPSERWFQGPSFLMDIEANWPKNIPTTNGTGEELVCSHQALQPWINISRFSSWQRLLRTTAYVYRYLNIKLKLQPDIPSTGILSCEELRKAETILFRIAQRDVYSEEFSSLKKQNKIPNKPIRVPASSSIKRLSPYLDDEQQLLRVKGRLDAAPCININTKRPIILPRDHAITKLLVQRVHEDFQHANNECVVNQLRQRYVIPKLRQQLKCVIKVCQWCKINKAKPSTPEMAPLPPARLSLYCNPFMFTGVDYFGPLMVTEGRRQEKRWGVLFTCLTTRAVHVEVAHKLDSDSFILCFQDFIHRRGSPQEIYCDRGTNFVGAEKMLRRELEAIDPNIIAKRFISPTTKWVFNPPASPRMGGAWERLVRSFKKALYFSLPTKTPTDQLLRSCLVAAEGMINSRPLTYMPLNDELEEALTPNHFLRLDSGGAQPIAQINDSPKTLRYTYQYKERFANKCWDRFIQEYAPELTLRTKWYNPVEPLKIGDLVIIVDKDLPRNNYPKGKVISVKASSDGQVRSATIQTIHGVFERPTIKLAKLEIGSSDVSTTSQPGIVKLGRTVKKNESGITELEDKRNTENKKEHLKKRDN